MVMNATDQGEVRLTGENPVMRIHTDPDKPPSTRASLWRVHLSPAGPGHVLFLISEELTNNEPVTYTDNLSMCRWLQGEIINQRWAPFNDPALPANYATFSREGDATTFVKETIAGRDDEITLTWYDLMEPFNIQQAPNLDQGQRHGHYALFIPARRIHVTRNGKVAPGAPVPQERDGRPMTSCFLAWAETWVRVPEPA